MLELRKLAFMANGTNGQKLVNTLASMGIKEVKGYICPIVDSKTGDNVTDAFIVEGKAPKIVWDLICRKMHLRNIHGYYM